MYTLNLQQTLGASAHDIGRMPKMLDGSRYSEMFPGELSDFNGARNAIPRSRIVLDPEAKAVLAELLRELQDFISPL
jgi:hypothetical protein